MTDKTQEETSQPEQEEEPTFTEEESAMFTSLLTVGCLSKVVNVFGYKIQLKTLNVDEDIQVGLALKKFDGTLAFNRAYKTLTVAAAVRSIDGAPLIQSLSPLDDIDSNSVIVKYEKVKTYYPIVIDEIYRELNDLEARMLIILSRLGKIKS